MGTNRRSRPWAGRLGAGVVLLTLVAGCNKGGTEPNVASGAVGELADALGAAEALLTSNQASFQSAQSFAPLVAATLAAAPAPPRTTERFPSPPAGISPSILGTTFDYDFQAQAYVETALTGAPPNGVRFLLYPVNASGTPQQGASNGHLDLTLTAVQRTGSSIYDVTFSIVLASTARTILSMNQAGFVNLGASTISVSGTGTLTSADGSTTLPFEGGKSGSIGALGGGLDLALGPVTATFGRAPGNAGSFFVTVVARKQVGQSFDWTFSLFASGDASEQISGPVILADPDIGEGVFACVAGAFSGPAVTAASNCASQQDYLIPNVGAPELQAVAAAYGGLYEIWAALFGLFGTAVDVAISTAG